MAWGLTLVTPPTAEPVTTAELREHLRIDIGDEDTLLAGLICAARSHAELVTRRQFVTATWRLDLDEFPRDWLSIPRPPLVSVSSVVYEDTAGVSQTWSSANYLVHAGSQPGRIAPVYGQVWPTTRWRPGAVQVTFVAGYGGPSAVPTRVKQIIRLLAAHWYEHREPVLVGAPLENLPFALEALLASESHGDYR